MSLFRGHCAFLLALKALLALICNAFILLQGALESLAGTGLQGVPGTHFLRDSLHLLYN